MDAPLSETGNEAESRLLQSALELFTEKGYEAASIREIIEGAGVTRPVLYYYFKNKEELFRRLIEPVFAELSAAFDRVLLDTQSTEERLRTLLRITFEKALMSPKTARLVFQMYFSPPGSGPVLDRSTFRRRRFHVVETIMREGMGRGEIVLDDPNRLALVFIGLMDTHVMAKSHAADLHFTPEFADSLVRLFLHGAAPRN